MSVEEIRGRMGRATIGLMDLTDEEVATAHQRLNDSAQALDELLRARGARVTQRAAMLIGGALAPITHDLQHRGED